MEERARCFTAPKLHQYASFSLQDGDTLLHHAAKNGNAGYVIALLAHGADKYITNSVRRLPRGLSFVIAMIVQLRE